MKHIDGDFKKRLAYRYLEILEEEGNLNQVLFDRQEWDDDTAGRYTKEFHGVDKLMAMIPDDVLIRQFGKYELLR